MHTQDAIYGSLDPVYGPNKTIADMLKAHWVAEGFAGIPSWQTRYDWYKAEGAAGTTLVDAEFDYWSNVYSGGGPPADPGLVLLQGSTLWLDASDDIANAQWVRNKGTGGRSLDAREGSVGSAQVVKGALKLNGIAGNNATSTVSHSSITDVDMMLHVQPDDWSVTANLWGVDACTIVGATKTYRLEFSSSNTNLAFTIGGSGDFASTAAHPFADGQAGWIRATYQSSSGTIKFYTAATTADNSVPSSWTQLGTNIAGPSGHSTGAIATYRINPQGNEWRGSVFRMRVLNGYDGAGTVIHDANFTAVPDLATSFTESSSNAATVTINSTTGVDTNDPLLLTHTGTNYLYLPGIAGNNCTVPTSSALNVTGSIDIRVRVALVDWTPSTGHTLVSKRNASGSDFSYELRVNSSGTLLFAYGSDSVTYNEETSSTGPTVSDGQAIWLRVTRDSSTGDVIYYQAADSSSMPSSWTQIGTTQTSTPSAIYASANNLNIGAFYHTTPIFGSCNGNFYRVVIYNGIGGTIVFDADFTANTNQGSFTESSSNAATVTINRTTSGRKAVMVTRPVWLFGTDDYMEIADNALLDFGASESLTVVAVTRRWATPPDFGQIIAKTAGSTAAGWVLLESNVDSRMAGSIADGTTQLYSGNLPQAINYTAGSMLLASMVRDTGADTLQLFVGSSGATAATDTTTGSLANALPVNIGRAPSGTPYYLDMEVVAVAVFRSALTSTELGQIATYYGV